MTTDKVAMYHIIVNAHSVKGKKLQKLEDVKRVFERAGRKYSVYMTEHPGHATQIAREITRGGGECKLVAMGGDGTLHEILNGVQYPDRCSLGLIPVGTGNDFAAAIELPDDAVKAAQIIAFKQPYPIDYIQVSNGLRSINAVGMGIDCEVLKRAYRSKNQNKAKYLRACIASLFKFESYKFTAEIDGEYSEHYGFLTCLGNGRQIGGGIKLFPEFIIDDGYMDVIMVDFISKPRAIKEFISLMTGKLKGSQKITLTKAKKVKIVREGDYVIQAEGELYQNVLLDAEIISGALKFYLP